MALLDVIDTAASQFRVGYDASNHAGFTVSSGGDLTIAPTGGDTSITGTLAVNSSTDSLLRLSNPSAASGSRGWNAHILSTTGDLEIWTGDDTYVRQTLAVQFTRAGTAVLTATRTTKGSVSAATATWVTLFSAPPAGSYLLWCGVEAGGGRGTAILTVSETGAIGVASMGGSSSVTFQASGTDVQAQQADGVTRTLKWSYLRLAI